MVTNLIEWAPKAELLKSKGFSVNFASGTSKTVIHGQRYVPFVSLTR
jgi:hypothetical protein